ncbi:transcriptional repressor [Fibrisoma montanum]|uniref:Transcriptional repressor n=1 Tax=Fibrisoma montanum TaxID=2305895 RepID=A0A418MKE5_9BACT|nr:Fur family transcriptional regulator [Fibrisoma montanum]RIV27801.1 transcriptional repressor [Fibrisoma montanum]
MSSVAQTLKNSGLRHTGSREEVLDLFLNADHALAHSDIEHGLGPDHDRVTIYRTLRTFLDKGIIHKVLDDEGGTKYALCRETCAQGHHQHEHVHFKCENCGQTTCLDEVHIPAVALPQGYNRKEMNLLIQGVCSDCNK